jgi:hypothetical protein
VTIENFSVLVPTHNYRNPDELESPYSNIPIHTHTPKEDSAVLQEEWKKSIIAVRYGR